MGFFGELGGVDREGFAGLGILGEAGHDGEFPGFEGFGSFEGCEEEVYGFAGIPGHGHVGEGLEGLGLELGKFEVGKDGGEVGFGKGR